MEDDPAKEHGATLDLQPAVTDPGKRIDILQKAYAEASNYDRHYSITRSTITVLLVTVALAALNSALPPLLQSLSETGHPQIHAKVAYVAVTPILLGFALIINMYFYRLTYACRLVELWIEEMIILNATGSTSVNKPMSSASQGINGLRFRDDLRQVVQKVSWFYWDPMAKLLICGELLFCGIVSGLLFHAAEHKTAAVAVPLVTFALAIIVLLPRVFARPSKKLRTSVHCWPGLPQAPATIADMSQTQTGNGSHSTLVTGLALTLVGAAAAFLGAFLPSSSLMATLESVVPEGVLQRIAGQTSLAVPGFGAIAIGTILQIVAAYRRRR